MQELTRCNRRIAGASLFLALLLGASACGDDATSTGYVVTRADGDETPFDSERIVVSTPDGDFVIAGDPGRDCVQLGEECAVFDGARRRYCNEEGAVVDVVVAGGEVAGGICYPAPSSGVPIDEVARGEDGGWEVPRNRNGGVLLFPADSDGEVLTGDVVLEGQRTTIFGNGPGNTILDGSISIRSNNSRVRGVTVLGDVTIDQAANNVGLSRLVIHGDLIIRSNNATVLDVTVLGDVRISGGGTQLLASRVAGTVTGSIDDCTSSRFIDLVVAEEAEEPNEEEAGEEETGEEGDEGAADESLPMTYEPPTWEDRAPLTC